MLNPNSLFVLRRFYSLGILLFLVLTISHLGLAQTSNISQGCAPLTVNFTAPAGSSSYFWDFMDGASSNLQNPNNTFANPGTYNVEFRETIGGPVIGTVSINVFAKPEPTISSLGLTQGCTPLNISFQGDVILPSGVTVNNYTWTFGEGSSATGQNVAFTYTNTGTYTVTLGITTNTPSCNNTVSYSGLVGASNPTANFTTNPSPAASCTAPLNVTFTNTSVSSIPLDYSWDFGNGNTSTLLNPPAQSYTTTGDFPVNLTITDTNGCVKTIIKNVSIGSPTAAFASPDTLCINTPILLNNSSSAGNYNWTFDAGTSIASSTQTNPLVTFLTPGLHTIVLNVSSPSGLCSDDSTRTIFIEDPTVSITAVPNPQCDSGAVYTYSVSSSSNFISYSWEFDDGSTSTDASPTHIYHIKDTAYANRGLFKELFGTVTLVTSGGCTIIQEFRDTVFWVYARFMPDVYQGCGPLTVEFSDSSKSAFPIVNYHYDYGDGQTADFPNNTPHTHVFTNSGEYPVVMTATNTLGCSDISDTIWIEVGETVLLDFVGFPLEICPKDSITFTNLTVNNSVIDSWNYSSDGELLSQCFGQANGTFAFDDTVGVFDITLTAEYNGCYSSETKANYIRVKGAIAKFNYLYDCSDTMSIQLINQSMGSTETTWDFGNGISGNSFDTTYMYPITGQYIVKLSAFNDTTGCPVSIDSTTIFIRKIEANFVADPVYCGYLDYPFDASASVDVHATCNTGYKWIFSDPGIRPITTANSSEDLQFEQSGNQTLTLVVRDENGCTDTATAAFNVYNVSAIFDLEKDLICLPDTLNFLDQSVSDTSLIFWEWDFIDGTLDNTQNTSHIFTSSDPNGYLIKLTVADEIGCVDTALRLLEFYKPISTISSLPTPAQLCVGQTVSFAATNYTAQGSSLTWAWNFGDGSTGNGQFVNHAYGQDTTVAVKMVYTEISSGCVDSTTYLVDVQGFPTANYTTDVDNLPALCSPQIINFTNQSNGPAAVVSTNWLFSSGQGSTAPNPAFVFTTGSYTGQLIVKTSYGCSDTIIKNFQVIGPDANFVLDTNYICQGDPIQFTITDSTDVGGYSWDFGDGNDTLDVSPISHSYFFVPPSGQTLAKLTVYGAGGVCPKTIEKPIFIREVRSRFNRNDELDTAICLGDVLTLTNNSLNGDVFTWQFGDGTSSNTGASSFTHTFGTVDTFLIQLSILNTVYGCRDTLEKAVIVFGHPDIKALGDTVCTDEIAQLNMQGYQNQFLVTWSPFDPLSDSSIFNPLADVNQTTIFQLLVLDTLTGCTSIDTAIVTVIPDLQGVYFDTTIVLGDTIALPIDNLNGYIDFLWSPDTLLSCYTCSYPLYLGLDEQVYTLTMSDVLGCSTAEGIFRIKIFPETFIDLPTTFTPNGDGVNDIIYLRGWGIKEVEFFQIYNRWGELVFESNDIDYGWDGYYKGILQNNDTYTYKARVKTFRDEFIEGAGHINLMR